jgi:hypothetical protein
VEITSEEEKKNCCDEGPLTALMLSDVFASNTGALGSNFRHGRCSRVLAVQEALFADLFSRESKARRGLQWIAKGEEAYSGENGKNVGDKRER